MSVQCVIKGHNMRPHVLATLTDGLYFHKKKNSKEDTFLELPFSTSVATKFSCFDNALKAKL